MSSSMSSSDAATVPAAVPFSSTPKVAEEVNAGATLAAATPRRRTSTMVPSDQLRPELSQ